MKDFIVAFSKEISLDDTLILAVSGGVDSMVLLDLIIASHPKEKIIIAHYDHSLRGDESDGDARLVRDTCARF
jgi:tRNA(Ile)-lysidine synthase